MRGAGQASGREKRVPGSSNMCKDSVLEQLKEVPFRLQCNVGGRREERSWRGKSLT